MRKSELKKYTSPSVIVLLFFLLIAQLIFSQGTYPQKVIVNGDTLIQITPKQLTSINLLIIENKECQELLIVEKEENKIKSNLIAVQEDQIEIEKQKSSTLKTETLLLSDQKSYLEKQLRHQKIKTKIFTGLGVVGGLISGFFIGHFI